MGSALFRYVRSPRHGTTLGDEPGDHVRDLFLGQRPRRVAAPIGHAEIGPSGYHHGPEVLIAREGEKRRIHHGAALRSSLALGPVAAGARGGEHALAPPRISR